MLVEDLFHRFKLVKNCSPSHVNELLDFVQRCYIDGEISITEYKELFFELDKRHAEKPNPYMMNTTLFEKVNITG